ncbi:MAG: sulfotransferase [Cyanobacteria bacterium J06623_5]
MRKQVVFIMGTAHCGSTLLTMVLGSHSDCLALGEVSNYPDAYRRDRPICSVCAGDCTFWNHHFSEQDARRLCHGFAERRLHKHIPLKLEKAVRGFFKSDQVFNPYSLIASQVEETTLIDSTKTVYWLEKKLAAREFQDKLLEPYLIHLIRDGRAVMGSYSRRKEYQGLSAADFGKQFGTLWQNRLNNEHKFYDSFSGNKIRLRYEEFATEPAQTAATLCKWLGLDFQPDMLNYWKHQHHVISGNSGTRASVQKHQTQSIEGQPDKATAGEKQESTKSQINKEPEIKLHTRWQKTLSPEQIDAFYRTTNNMNKAYEWQ